MSSLLWIFIQTMIHSTLCGSGRVFSSLWTLTDFTVNQEEAALFLTLPYLKCKVSYSKCLVVFTGNIHLFILVREISQNIQCYRHKEMIKQRTRALRSRTAGVSW